MAAKIRKAALDAIKGLSDAARGRRWLNELTAKVSASTPVIAHREGCSVREDQHDHVDGLPRAQSGEGGD
jgi:hypothetical protein